jgi:hypothetical protein
LVLIVNEAADILRQLAELREGQARLAEQVAELALARLTAQERRDAVTLVRGAAAVFGFRSWTVAEFAARVAAEHLSAEFTDVMSRYRDSAGGLRSLGRFLGRVAGLPVCELQLGVSGPHRDGRLYAVTNAGFWGQKHTFVVATSRVAADIGRNSLETQP